MKKFILSKSLLALILLNSWIGASPALASTDYQNVLGLVDTTSKEDGGDKTSLTRVYFQHYFSPVSTQGKPLNEAAFLNRAGSVEASFAENNISGSVDADVPFWEVNTLFAEKNNPWTFNLAYLKSDGQITALTYTDVNAETYTFGVGYFFSDELIAHGQYQTSEINIAGLTKRETTRYQMDIKWLHILSAQTAVNVEALIGTERDETGSTKEDGEYIGISADYYFTLKTSLGLAYSNLSHDDKSEEGSLIGITATHFVTPQFFITIIAGQFDAKNDTTKHDERLSLEIAFRL